MNIRKFSELNRLRCESVEGFNHRLNDWSPSDWFVAVTGEVGEAANILKKLNRIRDGVPGNAPHETKEHLSAALATELADAFIYLDLTAQALNIDLYDAVTNKFNATSDKIGSDIKLS